MGRIRKMAMPENDCMVPTLGATGGGGVSFRGHGILPGGKRGAGIRSSSLWSVCRGWRWGL